MIAAETRKLGEGAGHVQARRQLIAALAGAGVAGPIGFTALVVVQGLLHPEYSHVALPISALAAWPGGWLQSVNFVVLGALMSAYAVGLHLGVRSGHDSVLGPALLVLSGIGLVAAGAFPWRAVDGAFVVPPGHLAGAFLAFLGAGSGLIALSRRLIGDPRWRDLTTYALATGLAILVLFVVLFALARSPGAPLYQWAGILQRITVALWFACTIVLALRLLRVARKAPTSASALPVLPPAIRAPE